MTLIFVIVFVSTLSLITHFLHANYISFALKHFVCIFRSLILIEHVIKIVSNNNLIFETCFLSIRRNNIIFLYFRLFVYLTEILFLFRIFFFLMEILLFPLKYYFRFRRKKFSAPAELSVFRYWEIRFRIGPIPYPVFGCGCAFFSSLTCSS